MVEIAPYLDAKEIGRLLGGLHPGTVRRWLARGDFGDVRPVSGRGYMITRLQFIEWWEQGVRTPALRTRRNDLVVDMEVSAGLDRKPGTILKGKIKKKSS